MVRHAGGRQIVVAATKKVRAYEFDTGRLVWEVAGLGANTIPRPVQHEGMVLVMSGFRNPALLAIRLGRMGDLTGTDAVAVRDRMLGLGVISRPLNDVMAFCPPLVISDAQVARCVDALAEAIR